MDSMNSQWTPNIFAMDCPESTVWKLVLCEKIGRIIGGSLPPARPFHPPEDGGLLFTFLVINRI